MCRAMAFKFTIAGEFAAVGVTPYTEMVEPWTSLFRREEVVLPTTPKVTALPIGSRQTPPTSAFNTSFGIAPASRAVVRLRVNATQGLTPTMTTFTWSSLGQQRGKKPPSLGKINGHHQRQRRLQRLHPLRRASQAHHQLFTTMLRKRIMVCLEKVQLTTRMKRAVVRGSESPAIATAIAFKPPRCPLLVWCLTARILAFVPCLAMAFALTVRGIRKPFVPLPI